MASAEKYICAYIFEGEAKPVSLERMGSHFVKSNGAKDTIIYEDSEALVLSSTYTVGLQNPSTFTTIINKEALNFVMGGLQYGGSSAVIEGSCEVY